MPRMARSRSENFDSATLLSLSGWPGCRLARAPVNSGATDTVDSYLDIQRIFCHNFHMHPVLRGILQFDDTNFVSENAVTEFSVKNPATEIQSDLCGLLPELSSSGYTELSIDLARLSVNTNPAVGGIDLYSYVSKLYPGLDLHCIPTTITTATNPATIAPPIQYKTSVPHIWKTT